MSVRELKTVTKKLEPGKWRIGIAAGHEVIEVRLLGMRRRWFHLNAIEKADFHSRLMKRPNGEVSDATILRGAPAVYIQDGPWLMIWPAPAHAWTLQFDTLEKVKA